MTRRMLLALSNCRSASCFDVGYLFSPLLPQQPLLRYHGELHVWPVPKSSTLVPATQPGTVHVGVAISCAGVMHYFRLVVDWEADWSVLDKLSVWLLYSASCIAHHTLRLDQSQWQHATQLRHCESLQVFSAGLEAENFGIQPNEIERNATEAAA